MADYQEYRRRVLRKRWRRRFMAAALLLLLLLVGAIGMLWKSLHREQRPSGMGQNTILQEVTQDNTWNTVSYAVARQLTVQTLAGSAATALDFRMAALPKSSTAVGKEWFNDVSFVGDSLTQGMQLYEEGMQNAMFCAYKGVGPNVIVNGTTCKRAVVVRNIHVAQLVHAVFGIQRRRGSLLCGQHRGCRRRCHHASRKYKGRDPLCHRLKTLHRNFSFLLSISLSLSPVVINPQSISITFCA